MSAELDPRYARPLHHGTTAQQPQEAAAPQGRLKRLAMSLVRTRIDKSTWRIRLVALGFACLFGVIGEIGRAHV